MMKHTLFLFLLLCMFAGQSQDTIYKRNGELISAKISEISASEIKYKRFTMQDGPMFIMSHDEVKMIRFANGVIDSFAVTAPVTTQTVMPSQQPPVIVMNRPVPQQTGLIQSAGSGTYYFNQARINEKKLLFIAADKNRTWKNKELTNAIIATRDFKNNQYISGFGGAAVAIICLIASSQSAQNSANTNVSGALVFNGLGIFIASQIVSPMFKRKRARSARRVVDLYNQEVLK